MEVKAEVIREPDRFSKSVDGEVSVLRFRCPYCGTGQQAVATPGSPRIAKFRCTRCDNVSEVETRPSCMDTVDEWFNEGKDIRDTMAKRREWSKNVATLVQTKLGPAFLID